MRIEFKSDRQLSICFTVQLMMWFVQPKLINHISDSDNRIHDTITHPILPRGFHAPTLLSLLFICP